MPDTPTPDATEYEFQVVCRACEKTFGFNGSDIHLDYEKSFPPVRRVTVFCSLCGKLNTFSPGTFG